MTYYAYVYVDPRDGVPFYVGKGQRYRAHKHLHQCSNAGLAARLAELRAVGIVPDIRIYHCDNEPHAYELERVLIDAYGRRVNRSGTLYNILEAGECSGGMAGRKHRPESIERIRAAMKARRLTPEHKAKIGAWGRTPAGRAARSAAGKRGNATRKAQRAHHAHL